jgi:YHS domain-containing protein
MFVLLFRLILFLIAISVIRSVLNYLRRLWFGFQSGRREVGSSGRPLSRKAEAASTMLKMDPVCGTYVAVDSSFKKIAGGKVYHFCSAECRNRFAA